MRQLAYGVGLLLILAVGIAAVGLGSAHIAIRRERPALPPAASVTATGPATGAQPVRLTMINTASQPMPRAAVLDKTRDPAPNTPYVMSHPSFVLEWPDGRLLLIDVGMTREQALAFGGRIEMLSGGEPIQPLGSVAEQLGAARDRVGAVVFTHLHADHVGGIGALCSGRAQPLPVPMTAAQAQRPNYTTRGGLRDVREAGCTRVAALQGTAPLPLSGFPGVTVIPAGGHTPGSQIIVADVAAPTGRRVYVFAGDIVNNADGFHHDVPKPFLYSLLLVPEDGPRLAELRAYLETLEAQHGATVLISHDQRQLEAAGLAAWAPRG